MNTSIFCSWLLKQCPTVIKLQQKKILIMQQIVLVYIAKKLLVQVYVNNNVLLCFYAGILCGRCRHSHQGVGVLTMLCQDCENDSITFLPIVLLGQ